jgi:hypothetical protein
MKTQKKKKKTNKNSKLFWRSSSQAICPASRFWAYFDKQKGNVAKESQKKKKKKVRMADGPAWPWRDDTERKLATVQIGGIYIQHIRLKEG